MKTDVENPTPQACPYDGESETRALYLAGKLSATDAEAFEAHYFDCDRCAEAVEIGTKVRSAFGNEAVKPAASPPAVPPRKAVQTWLPLAAAAAVALGALGLWQLTRRGPVETAPVLRGETSPMNVRIEAGPGGALRVSWTPPLQAQRFVVRILEPDGRSVWSGESREPSMTIESSALATATPGTPLSVQVEALDVMERVLATSEPAPIPDRSR